MEKIYEEVSASDGSRIKELFLSEKCFKVVGLKAGNMSQVVKEIEKGMEAAGLKVRVYTKNRHIAAAIAGPIGLAALGVHNLATRNPDYEICKDITNNELTIDFVGNTSDVERSSEQIQKEWNSAKDSISSQWDNIKNSAFGNAVANIADSGVTALKDGIAWADDLWQDIFNEDNYNRAKESIDKIAKESWDFAKQQPEKVMEKYNNLDKGYKILVLTGIAGGTVIALPFAVAAASGVSIVSALAILGGGAVGAGGLGVAGGIVVTAGGTALSASLAASLGHKFIKDPEVDALIDNFNKLEKDVQKFYAVMEKQQEQGKRLYSKYAEIAKYMTLLQKQIEDGGKYDIKQVRDFVIRSEVLIEDLNATFGN